MKQDTCLLKCTKSYKKHKTKSTCQNNQAIEVKLKKVLDFAALQIQSAQFCYFAHERFLISQYD